MISVIDVVYYYHSEYKEPQQVLQRHASSLGFAAFINSRFDIQFVKHLDYEGIEKINGITYAFFKGRNRFWHVPYKTNKYIRDQVPDVVIIEGLIFPLQLIFLKLRLGRKCRIIAQHHGEKPFKGLKGIFQRIADKYISTYLFTSIDNAEEWIRKGIIRNSDKCRELLEASTDFTRKDKAESCTRLGIKGEHNFLWVGRLDSNKDPFTVLDAFEQYAATHADAVLYMIYQEDELLADITRMLKQSRILANAVVLIGKIEHEELTWWFSAADFYISGSHKEGSGYALLEAMACGCIPIVTDIPSFRKITSNGKYGFLYPPGDSYALSSILRKLNNISIDSYRNNVENYFNEHLSFKNIADELYNIICTMP